MPAITPSTNPTRDIKKVSKIKIVD
ncbi:MAG: hypothetical protein PWQ66_1449, partial [Petrotoga sp.]|nr:hypothetical protein [Petrotoga sp.]